VTRFSKYTALFLLASVPFLDIPDYYMHVLILILIWGSVDTSGSIRGRRGLVPQGHGACQGMGGYTGAM
jgi:hypothetical protein